MSGIARASLSKWALLLVAAVLVLLILVFFADRTLKRFVGIGLWDARITRVLATGQVLDDQGRGVPYAHVIVIAWRPGVKATQRCFGLVADETGYFQAKIQSKEPLQQRLMIVAAGQGDMYGAAQNVSPSVSDGVLRANVTVTVTPLPMEKSRRNRYRYDTFCPLCPPEWALQFLDEGWKPVFRDSR